MHFRSFIIILILLMGCENKSYDNSLDPDTELGADEWAPSNLIAEILNDSTVILTWQQSENQIDGFNIERKDSINGTFAKIGVSASISYTDTTVILDNEYSYRVAAFNSVNTSGYSIDISVKIYRDCNGTLTGDATLDVCGICDANPQNDCIYDIDGNIYEVVQIGEQVWMQKNLKTTRYSNGAQISSGFSSASSWHNLTTGASALLTDIYGDDCDGPGVTQGCELEYQDVYECENFYGLYYNWYAVNHSAGICPEGFHIPSEDEWIILIDYLGGADVAGLKMKSTGTFEDGDGLWCSPSEGGTNESGFTVLPAGMRYNQGGGGQILLSAYFWTSDLTDENMPISVGIRFDYIEFHYGYWPQYGFSVRCLKD